MADGPHSAITHSRHGRHPGMTTISVVRDMLMIDIKKHNCVDIIQEKVLKDIQASLESGLITSTDLSRRIIFNTLCEGHGVKEMTATIKSLENETWFNRDNVVFLHNVFDKIPDSIKQVPWVWYMTNHSNWLHKFLDLNINWQDLFHNRWILCLMRRPSHQRSHLLRQLLERFDSDQCRISYASMIDAPRFDPESGQHIPILLDGPTPGDQQHEAQDERIFSCVLNLIVETSCQEKDQYAWTSNYTSEKTFKCFGWKQLPVWFASPGLVSNVRSLGFDVFDDIIDHDQYDSINDPVKRMAVVLDIIEDFLNRHKDINPQDFYEQIYHRLEKNYNKLLDIDSKRLAYWSQILRKCKDV